MLMRLVHKWPWYAFLKVSLCITRVNGSIQPYLQIRSFRDAGYDKLTKEFLQNESQTLVLFTPQDQILCLFPPDTAFGSNIFRV